VKAYLAAIGTVMKSFPDNSHFYVEDAPTGRAYMQLAMRAFYQNPTLFWIANPDRYMITPNEPAYLIRCFWDVQDNVQVTVHRVN